MNSSVASKLLDAEVKYKEIEVNNQRDQRDLNGIEAKLASLSIIKKEASEKHDQLMLKYQDLTKKYDQKKEDHFNLKMEIQKLQLRERDINDKIKELNQENKRLTPPDYSRPTPYNTAFGYRSTPKPYARPFSIYTNQVSQDYHRAFRSGVDPYHPHDGTDYQYSNRDLLHTSNNDGEQYRNNNDYSKGRNYDDRYHYNKNPDIF